MASVFYPIAPYNAKPHEFGFCILADFPDSNTPQSHLSLIRRDRALATAVGLEVRWLPTATPELNACEGLWRGAKGSGLANRAGQSIDDAADAACRYILDLTPRQRLQLAGVLSGHFWLAT
jgi:hypothetical protein